MDIIYRDLALLHPRAIAAFTTLASELRRAHQRGEIEHLFLPFETYRSPLRQASLPPDVTRAGPWRSAHQYGLAVDFVPKVKGEWSWSVPTPVWNKLRAEAREQGLVNELSWDRAHVEHPLFAVAFRSYARDPA